MPILIENLTHIYMPGSHIETTAIHDISFTINDGEFLGIIGHTGSGKSTLIQHLNGLLLPTSGRVLVDGLDISNKKQRKLARALVGLVFQYPEYQLFEETVQKDVAFGPKNMGLEENEINQRVAEALELVELDPLEILQKSPFELSGGQKRRVALAGVFAMRPRFLVLDEPMAGLDPRGRREILRLIQALRERTGCTVVMVSHSMDDVAKHADRIAVLQKGRLMMQGTPAKVFAREEELTRSGLSIPQAAQLALALKRRGVEGVPEGIFRLDELKAFLVSRLCAGK